MNEKQSLLIVDDSELNRELLMAILGESYTYIEAENGRRAIQILQEGRIIDLMLLDINMPEMDGFQVLQYMQQFRLLDEVPVIMISSEESVSTMEQAYNLGITDYIRRPFNSVIVKRRVENTLKISTNQKRLMHMLTDQIHEKEENNDTMIGILSHVVEFRNSESGDHICRIRTATELLLRKLVEKTDSYPLSEAMISLIVTASALHDIGKISIPEAILNKPGKLTEEEFGIIKTHAAAGAKIIEEMSSQKEKPLLRIAWEICRWHHERWDGNGYPDGLIGESIPIGAQVVALADVYDALTSERCYKKAFEHNTAIEMILDGQCGAFNPLLLQCLQEVSLQLARAFRNEADEFLYWREAQKVSEEIFQKESLPYHDHAQRILEVMREKMNFIDANSGGILIELNALTGTLKISDWRNPTHYQKMMKTTAEAANILGISSEDQERIKEALRRTTSENREFSLEMKLPSGNGYRWYHLKIHAVWSELDKEKYIGAVGYLKNIQQMESDLTVMPDALKNGSDRLLEKFKYLSEVFDIVRLVDPVAHHVLQIDEQGIPRPTGEICSAFWDNGWNCANCISLRTLEEKATFNKVEFLRSDMFYVIARHIEIQGVSCVLELISKADEGRWIDANGTRLLLDQSRGENLELFHDPVTGAYSRRYYETYMKHLEGMHGVSVIDVNDFKSVNDTYGHQAGDHALRDVAAAIRANIKSTDILIRYGGDEFLLLYPTMTEDQMEENNKRLREAVQRIVIPEYSGLSLSISIGCVCGIHPIEEAVRKADALMYEDKAAVHGETSPSV